MRYNVDIIYCGNTLFSVEVEANSIEQAREFAYEQMEMYTYAEATLIVEE